MKAHRPIMRALRTAKSAQRWCSVLWRGEDGLTVSYAGRAGLAPAIEHLTWQREGREVERTTHSPANLGSVQPAAADVRVVDPWLLDRMGQAPDGRMPVYLEARTPLAKSLNGQLERVTNKPLRRKMRQVARGKLKWRESRSWPEFHRFYRDLYSPFAGSRFGDGASVLPERALALKFARGGRLVFAESERGEHGALLVPAPDDHRALWWNKVGHSQPDAPATFIEVAVFDYAISVGAPRLDWGLCPPVTTDGLYIHKRRCGAEFSVMQGVPTLPLFLAPGVGERVFSATPMVVERDETLEVWVGGEGAEKLLKRSRGGGITRARVFQGAEASERDLA